MRIRYVNFILDPTEKIVKTRLLDVDNQLKSKLCVIPNTCIILVANMCSKLKTSICLSCVHNPQLTKNYQIWLVRKTVLFFDYCEISDIFTEPTHFLPVKAKGLLSFALTTISIKPLPYLLLCMNRFFVHTYLF